MPFDDRMDALWQFVKNEDWELMAAGQRLQIIKNDEYNCRKLQFDTKVISSKDLSITCLLGASPDASTAVKVMIDVLEKAFPEITQSKEGAAKLKELIPFWNIQVEKWILERELQRSKEALHL